MNYIGKTFYIEQLGCPSNRADGNRIANFLIENEWKSSTVSEADLIIVMTCGFSFLAQKESLHSIQEITKKKKQSTKMWIGGCLPSINSKLYADLPVDETFNPRSLAKLNRLAEGRSDIRDIAPGVSFSSITKYPENVYLLRISTGCTEQCSYCAIRRATGRLKSRPIKEIITEIVKASENGKRNIILLGEDIGCYGLDLGESIFSLFQYIKKLLTNATFFMSSIHPKYFIREVDKYIALFSYPFIAKKISIPLQSGSETILNLMNRDYSIKNAIIALREFHKKCPEVEMATDLMVGFPRENIADFEATRSLVHDFPFSYIDCFQYDEIPGVSASRIKDRVSIREKKRRLRMLSLDVVKEYLHKNNISSRKRIREFLSTQENKIYLNTNIEL